MLTVLGEEYREVGIKSFNVVDGNTVDALVSLGYKMSEEVRLRLARINAPENRGEEKEQGLISTNALREYLESSDMVVFRIHKTCYGRGIAVIYVERSGVGINVNDWMVSSGYAVST